LCSVSKRYSSGLKWFFSSVDRALFPCGDNLVCIIDDREDVWNFAPNLVHVKPYHFFQHTGDINAPPGLAKCENDDKEGFDFTKISGDECCSAFFFFHGLQFRQ
jgi:hypothetical protein